MWCNVGNRYCCASYGQKLLCPFILVAAQKLGSSMPALWRLWRCCLHISLLHWHVSHIRLLREQAVPLWMYWKTQVATSAELFQNCSSWSALERLPLAFSNRCLTTLWNSPQGQPPESSVHLRHRHLRQCRTSRQDSVHLAESLLQSLFCKQMVDTDTRSHPSAKGYLESTGLEFEFLSAWLYQVLRRQICLRKRSSSWRPLRASALLPELGEELSEVLQQWITTCRWRRHTQTHQLSETISDH